MGKIDAVRRLDRQIDDIRKEIGLGKSIYLDWARFGAEPKFVQAAVRDYQAFERTYAANMAKREERAQAQVVSLSQKLAALFAGEPQNIFLTTSTSQAISLVYTLRSFVDEQFHRQGSPDALYGFPFVIDSAQDLGRKPLTLATITGNERDRLVRERIAGRTQEEIDAWHEQAAAPYVLWSDYLPMVAFSGSKWLLGPRGAGGIALPQNVRKQLDTLASAYLSRLRDEMGNKYHPYHHFTAPANYRFPQGDGFRAYHELMCGRATLPVDKYAGIEKAIDFIKNLGETLKNGDDDPYQAALGAFASRIQRLTDAFTAPVGFELQKAQPGFVLVRPQQKSSDDLFMYLSENNVACTKLNGDIRFSIHYANTEDELTRVFRLLKKF